MAEASSSSDVNDKVILLVDGSKICARRSQLKNASDYFAAMFTSGMTESQEEVIEIKQVDKNCLQTLVKFSQFGEVNFEEEVPEQLLSAAVYLQFCKVVSKCCDYLGRNLTTENCLRILNLAFEQCLPDLEKAAFSYALANFLGVVKTEDFRQLTLKNLKRFLQSENLKVISEDDVYEALVLWLDSNQSVSEDTRADLVKMVRLPFLSSVVIDKATTNPTFKSVKEKLNEIKSGGGNTGWKPRKATAGILLAIGIDGNHVWDVYDPVEEVWQTVGTAGASGEGGRYALADDVLYYAGGVSFHTDKSDFSYLNFREEKWEFGPKLLQARNHHGSDATDLPGALAGTQKATRNPRRGSLLPSARLSPCVIRVAWLEGALYVVGGQHAHVEEVMNVVEQWQPDSNKWQNVAALPAPGGFFGLTVMQNKIYVVGGVEEYFVKESKAVYCFDPHRNEWSNCPPLNVPRCDVGVGHLEGVIYAAGGSSSYGLHRTFEGYDPRVGRWVILPEMSRPRSETAVTSCAGELFIVGGQIPGRRVGVVEIYDPAAKTWRKGSSLQSCPEDLQIFNLPSNASFFRKDIS